MRKILEKNLPEILFAKSSKILAERAKTLGVQKLGKIGVIADILSFHLTDFFHTILTKIVGQSFEFF